LAGAVILELGGGVGLATLAAALHAKVVICTGKVGVATQASHSSLVDTGDNLLELCCRNIDNNLATLGDLVQGVVGVVQ